MQNCSNELTVKYSAEMDKSVTFACATNRDDRLTETGNVQNTNVIARRFKRNALIYVRHDMIEQSAVQRFR